MPELAAVITEGVASPGGIRRAVEGAGIAGPLAFVGLYAALTVLFVPGTIGSAAAGALFGAVWGTGLVVIGATLGATASFVLARSLALLVWRPA